MVYILAINPVGFGDIVEEHIYKTFNRARNKAIAYANTHGNEIQCRVFEADNEFTARRRLIFTI